jgi:ribose 5-phosphate isomerase B
MKKGVVVIGSDHAGVALKDKIVKHLISEKVEFEDYGSFDAKAKDDYPDFAFEVGERVSKGRGKFVGVLVCDTGIGMSIAVNKVKGVRGALAGSEFMAKRAREHNDANVLCLGSESVSSGKAIKIVDKFLKGKESKVDRHKRRVRKIGRYLGK